MAENRDTSLWERDVLISFCDLCLAEIAAGNRPTSYFNKEGWSNLVASFGRATGRSYDMTQLKNKWDDLMNDWILWNDSIRNNIGSRWDPTKKTTGLRWDPTKKTISASDAWWAEKIKANPDCKKFKTAGIDPELEEKLDLMFGGVVATGEYAFAPSQCSPHINDELIEEGSSSEFRSEHSQSDTDQEQPNIIRQSSSVRRRGQHHSFLREQITELVSACKSIPLAKSTVVSVPSVATVIKMIEEMPEIYEDVPLYLHSLLMIRDDRTREVVMHIAPERRLTFLRHLFDNHRG